jgi:hypothetical protein
MSDVLTDTVLRVLGEFFEGDPDACQELFSKRVTVNETVGKHKLLACREKKGGKHEIGMLGLINSVLVAAGNSKVVVMTAEDGTVAGFAKPKSSSTTLGGILPVVPPPPPSVK